MGRTRRALVIAAFTLVSCSSQVVPASTPTSDAVVLRLYTTTSTIPLINDLSRTFAQLYPSVSFDITTGNYEAVAEAVSRRSNTYFITSYLPIESPLWAAPIGQDGIAVVINPENKVEGLSIEQLRSIYQGRITNWVDVGGLDQEITVISREEGAGTRIEFEQQVMGNRHTTQSAEVAPSSAAVILSVARKLNSIGYVSMSYLDASVTALSLDDTVPTLENVYQNTYPLRSTIFIVGEYEPQDDYRAFIAWVQSPTGQAVVAQHYAPLLRP